MLMRDERVGGGGMNIRNKKGPRVRGFPREMSSMN